MAVLRRTLPTPSRDTPQSQALINQATKQRMPALAAHLAPPRNSLLPNRRIGQMAESTRIVNGRSGSTGSGDVGTDRKG